MKRFAFVLSAISIFFFIGIQTALAAIDLNVIPIKYELETQTWATVTKSATLVNNWPEPFTIYTWKSDFVANGTDGTPRFVRYSELVHPDQQLSSWITIDTDSFVIGAWERKTINFTIDVPVDATPGGHYWAVFFKNNASETSTWWNIWINVDYWIIILVDVAWDVITDWEVWEILISTWGWATAKKQKRNEEKTWDNNDNSPEEVFIWEETPIDNCPLGDLSPSNIDWTCIGRNLFIPFIWNTNEETIIETQNNTENKDGTDEDEFEVIFELPFTNTWNSHIKPGWSVVLVDEDGKEIKQIWREVITNDNGAVIWEKIVDYIPLNDNGWNVLPNTTRIFNGEWKWFPYKEYDDSWELVIKYWDPGTYYTKENIEEKQFLQLWERVCEKRNHKKITALIDFSYTDQNGEEIEFNSAEEFEIEYVEQYIGINPFVIIPFIFFLLLLVFLVWFFIIAKKEKRCKKCDTKVKKNWKICPKCNKKLKK